MKFESLEEVSTLNSTGHPELIFSVVGMGFPHLVVGIYLFKCKHHGPNIKRELIQLGFEIFSLKI